MNRSGKRLWGMLGGSASPEEAARLLGGPYVAARRLIESWEGDIPLPITKDEAFEEIVVYCATELNRRGW